MTTEQELQSLLLRLSVLLASSLSTLSEPLPPTIIDPSSSSTYNAEKLSAQILNDISLLLQSVQKCCTNLTLALKPSKTSKSSVKAVAPKSSGSFSPIDGLDSASLNAAKAQLDALIKDCVPKLTWLSRKASSESIVYQYIPKSEDDLSKEQEERELVMSKGGHIVQQSHSREKEKLEKIKGKGLGVTWSKAIVAVIFELEEALGDLSEAFMSERTLSALQKASEARTKGKGGTNSTPSISSTSSSKFIKTREEARQRALQATSKVWNVCDSALKGKLPRDNRIAVRVHWEEGNEMLEDALNEYKSNAPGENSDRDHDFDSDEDESEEEEVDDDRHPHMMPTEEEMYVYIMYEPMLKAAYQVHSKIGEVCFKQISEGGNIIDWDDLDEAGELFSAAYDELIAAISYGERENGHYEEAEGEIEARDELHQVIQDLYHLTATADVNDAIKTVYTNYESSFKDVQLLY